MSDIRVMQVSFDITALDALLKHATAAARRVGHIDSPAVGRLADDIDVVVRKLNELLGEPLRVPKLLLVGLLSRASSAARIVGDLDSAAGSPAAEQLSDNIDAIVHELSELLGAPQQIADPVPADDRRCIIPREINDAIDELRQLIGRADALASTTREQFCHVVVIREGDDRREVTHLAHLVEMTALAVSAASEAGSKLIANVERELSQGERR
jgi:hypothetical protein